MGALPGEGGEVRGPIMKFLALAAAAAAPSFLTAQTQQWERKGGWVTRMPRPVNLDGELLGRQVDKDNDDDDDCDKAC